MKKSITICIIIFTAFMLNGQNLLNGPQKIVIDTEHNRYLVSNYYSGGDLVQIDSLGNQSFFIENAGMVDGLEIIEDTIYGSALGGKVKGYNLETGDLVMNLDLSGDGVDFLSGFVSDSAGFLYVSERFGTRIFKINPKTQDYWVLAEGNGIDEPNGLLYEPELNRIIICIDQPNPPILTMNLTDSTISTVTTTILGGSDGIAKDMNGYYYVTGYYLPAIYKFNSDFSGEPEIFFEGNYIVYPTYNVEHNSLLITYYNQNNWEEIPLTPSSIISDEFHVSTVLHKSYPNPFTSSTTIKFDLNKYATIRLEVCDSAGRIINTLINENKSAGNYSASWDGKDNSGYQVSNGTYFFRLTVNGATRTQSIVLLNY